MPNSDTHTKSGIWSGLCLCMEPCSPRRADFGVSPLFSYTTLMLNLYSSKDAVVHLWNLSQAPKTRSQSKPYQTIDCSSEEKVDSDLTSLDWNCHGTLLSVGSYDATLRIYTASAELYFESKLHKVGTLFQCSLGSRI